MSTYEKAMPGFDALRTTKLTRTIHNDVYPAISPSRPELSQAGRTILVPGGGTGVGFAIASAFVRAHASKVIIVSRRAEVLASAASKLSDEAAKAGASTQIITRTCDVCDREQVNALWNWFLGEGIVVDVLVPNVAVFAPTQSLLDFGTDGVWSQFETNVKSQLLFAEKFNAQGNDRQKFIVNVSTNAAHAIDHPAILARPSYTLTKLSATVLFQLIAGHVSPDKVQIISYHPGLIYNDEWATIGLPPQAFDKLDLAGAFAVWGASKEAEFLHGRFVWASWDVEELAEGRIRKRIEEDAYFLRASILGVRDDNTA